MARNNVVGRWVKRLFCLGALIAIGCGRAELESGQYAAIACGDHICASTETPTSCPRDCSNNHCGDGICSVQESVSSCPSDCTTANCGDGTCSAQENAASCPQDCSNKSCGDGVCSATETPATCPKDCVSDKCGDGVCGKTETVEGCPSDCRRDTCNNGICEATENASVCMADCHCGSGYCESAYGETAANCPADCKTSNCGNHVCEPGENSKFARKIARWSPAPMGFAIPRKTRLYVRKTARPSCVAMASAPKAKWQAAREIALHAATTHARATSVRRAPRIARVATARVIRTTT